MPSQTRSSCFGPLGLQRGALGGMRKQIFARKLVSAQEVGFQIGIELSRGQGRAFLNPYAVRGEQNHIDADHQAQTGLTFGVLVEIVQTPVLRLLKPHISELHQFPFVEDDGESEELELARSGSMGAYSMGSAS
jgi:hypothetical protein